MLLNRVRAAIFLKTPVAMTGFAITLATGKYGWMGARILHGRWKLVRHCARVCRVIRAPICGVLLIAKDRPLAVE
jgi:hypothetical protein